jgi:spermidine synthase
MKSLFDSVTSRPAFSVSTASAAPRGTWASALSAATLLMVLSGFAGLGYQIVWTEQFGVWLGHDIVAVLAVVAAFFGGLGLGAFALARAIAASKRPVAWYAGCEAAIAAWGLVLSWLLPAAGAWLAALTGPQPSALWQWTLAFIGPFLLLLPATFAMGATLPAIERISARLRSEGYAIGGLYAANTLGAVFGVLASAFVLVPWLGLTRTAQVCVALNLLCVVLALWRFGAGAVALPQSSEPLSASLPGSPHGSPRVSDHPAARRVLAILLATGALGIGYEVVVVRVLSQVAQDTVYTFALLLAAYLAGTAGGAAFYQRRLAGRHDAEALRSQLLCALAVSCLIGTLSLWPSDALRGALANALGANVVGALTAEAAIALAAFALPTFVMGALFSHLCVEAKAAGRGFGTAIGINTFGAAFAPLVFGVLLMPWLGAKAVLLVIAVGYLLLVPPAQWKRARVWAPAFAVAALALFAGELTFIDVPEGGRIVSYQDGVMATVSVVEDGNGVARLRINNRQQEGSSASLLSDARQAYLPLLLHPAPHEVLFLGLGTGITAASAAEDPTLKVDAVELLPEVVAAAPHFAAALGTALGAAPGAPVAQVLVGDARRHVRTTGQRYDVIVADLFHPARSGAGALYTVEHFTAIRSRLRADGLFCQWLPLHQLDIDTLRSITASFLQAYPGAMAMLATNSLDTPVLGLIARADGAGIDLPALHARLVRFPLRSRLSQLQLTDEFAVLGGLVAGPAELTRFAAGAPLNTDDRPVVVHRAPFITYAPDSLPRERLRTLLHAVQPHADALLAGAGDDPEAARWRQRLTAYWAARTQFIEAGMTVRGSGDAQAMLAQVRVPLLAALRTSADFRPAYDPLLNLARAIAPSDGAGARSLLAELAAANPSRPDAALLLRQLGP